jgi:hydrogenase maturation protease
MKRAKEAIIGLGNYLLADEGAGLHAVHLLEKKLGNKKIDIVAGGTPGFNLLHEFDDREKIIFIDAGNCGLEPGGYVRFRPEEVKSRKKNGGHSLHEFDLITFLRFAASFKENEKIDIVIYCIQPAEVRFAEELSPMVKRSLPRLVEKVYDEVIHDLRNEDNDGKNIRRY